VHTSALTIGNAAGAPVAGIAIDRWSPAAGFATLGAAGAAMAVVALALTGVQKRRAAKAAEAPITYLPSQRSATNGASHA
jgi:predicted MFS family arabinose efflux permease